MTDIRFIRASLNTVRFELTTLKEEKRTLEREANDAAQLLAREVEHTNKLKDEVCAHVSKSHTTVGGR